MSKAHMRRLNTSRLYKITKVLVIIMTVVSLALAIWLNYDKYFNSYSYYKDYWATIFKVAKSCRETYPNNQNEIDQCFEDATKPLAAADALAGNSIKVAIFLPLLFFGGTKLYKYLFPIKK